MQAKAHLHLLSALLYWYKVKCTELIGMKTSNIQMFPNGLVIHHYMLPVPGIRKKIIYQFSDTHLCLADDLSSEEESRYAAERSAKWLSIREGFARSHDQLYTEEQLLDAGTHYKNLLGHAVSDGDAVVMCGDVFECLSGANLRFYEEQMKNVTVPAMAVCGNHEPVDEIPDGYLFSSTKKPVQTIELDDMIIIGFENSRREVTKEQNECLLDLFKAGKPVIIAMHVPVMTEENAPLLKESGEYFQLNYDGASETTLEFIDILKQHSEQIIAVFAGHLHYPNVSEIAPGLTQYVSTQGILGNINRFEIGV